jgi:hypothetical protein
LRCDYGNRNEPCVGNDHRECAVQQAADRTGVGQLPAHEAAAKAVPGHMSSFFGEVEPVLQVEFAHQFNVPQEALVAAVKAFAAYSGESYALAA